MYVDCRYVDSGKGEIANDNRVQGSLCAVDLLLVFIYVEMVWRGKGYARQRQD